MAHVSFEFACAAGTPPRRRRVREVLNRGIALLLVFTIGCASKGEIVVHLRGEVSAQTDERLRVVVSPGDTGSLRLSVFREREQTLEIHYWKMPASGSGHAPYAQQESVRAGGDGSVWWQLWPLLVYPAIGVIALVGGAIAAGAELVGDAFVMLAKAARGDAPLNRGSEKDRATVWSVETVRRYSVEATIERADGTAKVELKRQPATGWVLDDRTMLQLGGRGAPVVVRDGELSAEVILGSPR